MVTRIPRFGRYRHGRGGEVLDLLQFEIHVACFGGKFCHVFFCTPWVGGNEVGDDLLVESGFAVDAVEDGLELMEEFEGRLTHHAEHAVGGMFGCNFQSS